MNRIKTAVIGCGKVGHFHARAYAALEKSEFTAVFDSDARRAQSFADQYGVRRCADIGALAEAGVQAVSICTPHPLHAQAAVEAARAGMHLLVEKPLAASLEDCDLILREAQSAGVTVGTVCQRRFYRPCMRIRRAIDDGLIGTPVLGTVYMLGWRDEAYYASDPWRGRWRAEGGGVLVNQSPHQLDLLQWYMGPIESVSGFWANLNHPYIEVEDTAVAVLRFRSGALASIVVSNSQNPALYGKVHVFGSNGAAVGVQTDGGAMFIAGMSGIAEPPVNDMWTVLGQAHMLDDWKREDSDFFAGIDALHYYHERQIEDFLGALLEGRPPLVDGLEGRKTVEIFTAIYRSNRDGKAVRFPLAPECAGDFDGRVEGAKGE